jgi:hypothetical protein
MDVDQRNSVRRKTDQLLLETIRVHRVLLSMLQGKGGNMSSALRRLQQLGVDLGRRDDDRRLGQTLSEGLIGIANRLLELGIIDQLPRRIRLTKILGKSNGKFPVGMEKVGWEMEIPKVGERYCLYLDDGRVFRTGQIAEYGDDRFRTGNSVYKIEVMEEARQASRTRSQPRAADSATG